MTKDVLILDSNFLREVPEEELFDMSSLFSLITIEEVEEESPLRVKDKILQTSISLQKLDKRSYEILGCIMKMSEISHLISYLNNTGLADPLILAYAIRTMERIDNKKQISLFGQRKVAVATNDQGVRRACNKLGIDVYSEGVIISEV